MEVNLASNIELSFNIREINHDKFRLRILDIGCYSLTNSNVKVSNLVNQWGRDEGNDNSVEFDLYLTRKKLIQLINVYIHYSNGIEVDEKIDCEGGYVRLYQSPNLFIECVALDNDGNLIGTNTDYDSRYGDIDIEDLVEELCDAFDIKVKYTVELIYKVGFTVSNVEASSPKEAQKKAISAIKNIKKTIKKDINMSDIEFKSVGFVATEKISEPNPTSKVFLN